MTPELLLEFSPIIQSTKILRSVERLYFSKLHLQVDLIDGSQFFIREIIIENILKEYSYHWQTPEGELIVRWDKNEHHSGISTFPFHKHTGNELNISEAAEQDLKSVLLFIESKIVI
jgi:hypothetical protein